MSCVTLNLHMYNGGKTLRRSNPLKNDKDRVKPVKSGRKRIGFSYDEVPQPEGEFKDLFQELEKKSKEATQNQRPSNDKKGNVSR